MCRGARYATVLGTAEMTDVGRRVFLALALAALALLTAGRPLTAAGPGFGEIVCCCEDRCAEDLFTAVAGDPPRLYYQDGTPLHWAAPEPPPAPTDGQGVRTERGPAPRPETSRCCVALRP